MIDLLLYSRVLSDNMVRKIGLGVVVNNNKILLVKRRFSPYKGKWSPPGGFVDKNENIKECVKREVKEETGINVEIKRFIKSIRLKDHKKNRTNEINFFLCNPTGGKEKKESKECFSIKWFNLKDIDNIDLIPIVKEILKNKLAGKLKIKGIGVSGGVVKGKIVILKELKKELNFEEGDILVTKNTTPSWMPLLKKAGGIITENGGMLSHSAIVARELGLPAIVGIEDIFKKIKDGIFVKLDGENGEIEEI